MFTEIQFTHLIYSITETIDLVSPAVANHHKLVAYISYALGKQLRLTNDELIELEIAASLHDIGGLTLIERLAPIEFEYKDFNRHAEKGYLLLNDFKPLSSVARIIRYHHQDWSENSDLPFSSYILNLADRVSILVNFEDENILSSADGIIKRICSREKSAFHPLVLEAFLQISSKDSFWLSMQYLEAPYFIRKDKNKYFDHVSESEIEEFIVLMSRIIDFKSRFTATHSSTLAACAGELGSYLELSTAHIKMIEYASYIHDLGKLTIPTEILDKPSSLTKDEFSIMRRHAFHTYRVLSKIKGFELIRNWGALHHEKLNGTGYPFGLKGDEIPLEARIIAVADIFSAIREVRPYRGQMTKAETIEILTEKVRNEEIDEEIVQLLIQNFDAIDNVRELAYGKAIAAYRKFTEGLQ